MYAARHVNHRTFITGDDYSLQDRGFTTLCWIWEKHTDQHGYGRCRFRGKPTVAHRAMYEHLIGPIPPGLTLDHLCGIKSCINPQHLEPVSSRVNKQRASKLTPELVAWIRGNSDGRSVADVAGELGVSTTAIYNAKNRKTWANL